MAGACAGVEVTDVAGVGVPTLATLTTLADAGVAAGSTSTTTGTTGTATAAGMCCGSGSGAGGGGVRSTSFWERKSESFKFRTLTPVASSSRTVGTPSRTVRRMRRAASWKSSSRKGA